jgi:hypothetical protein
MRLFIFLFLFFGAVNCSSQVVPGITMDSVYRKLFPVFIEANKKGLLDLPRDTSWNSLTRYESAAVSFKVPSNWIKLGSLGSVVDMAFDGTGMYFPEADSNGYILVGAMLLNQPGNSLEAAKTLALREYKTNTDRDFEAGYRDSVYEYNLPAGKKGFVLHTRFLRISKQLNQSRYDLILFSDALQKAFSVMITVQFTDPTYRFEEQYALQQFAARLFSYVELK